MRRCRTRFRRRVDALVADLAARLQADDVLVFQFVALGREKAVEPAFQAVGACQAALIGSRFGHGVGPLQRMLLDTSVHILPQTRPIVNEKSAAERALRRQCELQPLGPLAVATLRRAVSREKKFSEKD